MKYRSEFGPQRVFSLRTSEDREDSERSRLPDEYAPPRLFSPDLTYEKLASLLASGAKIKTLRLGEDFGIEDYQRENEVNLVPLFSLSGKNRLRVLSSKEDLEALEASDSLIALVWSTASVTDS